MTSLKVTWVTTGRLTDLVIENSLRSRLFAYLVGVFLLAPLVIALYVTLLAIESTSYLTNIHMNKLPKVAAMKDPCSIISEPYFAQFGCLTKEKPKISVQHFQPK